MISNYKYLTSIITNLLVLFPVSDGSRVWFSNDTPDSTALHGISPRPVKKMSFKTGPKQRANTQPTPPDSPRYK